MQQGLSYSLQTTIWLISLRLHMNSSNQQMPGSGVNPGFIDTVSPGSLERCWLQLRTDVTRPAEQAPNMSKAGRDKAARAVIERIRDASGASEDVITHVLEECNYDANEAVARLIDCEFPLILAVQVPAAH